VNWLTKSVLAVTAAGLALFTVVFASTVMNVATRGLENRSGPLSTCAVLPQTSGDPQGLTSEQLENARTIIEVGEQRGLPPYAWTVALATAMQESTLRNLNYGDRDSLGLFQQRPSQGWGTPAQVTDPVYAAHKFYEGLGKVPGWQQMSVTVAAQTVQRSAFPLAYAKHERLAAALVRFISDADPGACEKEIAPGEWTVPATFNRLTSRFGPRIHPVRGTRDFHTGLDFAAPLGTVVRAATSGVVISARPGGGYGNLVKIQHADGVETWYAHLASYSVRPGQHVESGEEIGRVGSTGNSTGPHLHFEVRVDGEPRDPEPWLREKQVQLAGV
jgi:murein DD-endopeptidase MepM/ murein hydrolase activator NlpD